MDNHNIKSGKTRNISEEGLKVECDFILNQLLHWKAKQDVFMSASS